MNGCLPWRAHYFLFPREEPTTVFSGVETIVFYTHPIIIDNPLAIVTINQLNIYIVDNHNQPLVVNNR